MKVYKDIDVYDFMMEEVWSGARDTVEELTEDEARRVADEIEIYFADSYEAVTETTLNDLLWFESDLIAQFAGYADWEDLTTRHDWANGKYIGALTRYPFFYADELQELRENIEAEADEDTPEDERNEAEQILALRGWVVDNITLQDLSYYYENVHFVYDDFLCHK